MGNRQDMICEAVRLLEKNRIKILAQSSIIETDPVGGPVQEKFLNGAIKAETLLSPNDLLNLIKTIERQLGRMVTVKNGPRPIDIDILLYNNISIKTPTLTIPHPRMFEREFVMTPLKEINPEIS